MAGKGAPGRNDVKAWQYDLVIATRVARRAEMEKLGKTRAEMLDALRISKNTFDRDTQRMISVMHERCAAEMLEKRAQADEWLRQVILDADKATADRRTPAEMKPAHQANKTKAIDSYVKLWGLAKASEADAGMAHAVAGIVIQFAAGVPLPPPSADRIIDGTARVLEAE